LNLVLSIYLLILVNIRNLGKIQKTSRQTEETAISTSGVKVPRTPTAPAATTDVDSAEHKQLPKRRFSIKQTTMMFIWQLFYYTYQFITLPFAFVFPFAHGASAN
jgi:hypothetical protein